MVRLVVLGTKSKVSGSLDFCIRQIQTLVEPFNSRQCLLDVLVEHHAANTSAINFVGKAREAFLQGIERLSCQVTHVVGHPLSGSNHSFDECLGPMLQNLQV